MCKWHRRAGKDLFAINLIATKLMQRVGTYWHLLPTYKQGRAIVWNGFTKDGRKFLDHFPKQIVTATHNNEMRLHFKHPEDPSQDGSIYQVVGTDDINSLVGTNPIGCVFSEYSLHDPNAWNYLRPILKENDGWALFIYTPRGKNFAYKLFQMASTREDWFCEALTCEQTFREDGKRVYTEKDIEDERATGMSEEMVQQEYYVSDKAPLHGAYYATHMERAMKEGRIATIPWEPKLPVNTYWDIGVGDSTAIVFAQQYGLENRIIDYYENSGEGLTHYAKHLKEQPYAYGKHFAPFDIEVREWTAGGKTRKEVAAKLGIRFVVTPLHELGDGIEQVRNILQSCWFDAAKCDRLIEALKTYRKEWNEITKCFKDTPVRDWSTHPADAFRYFAWNVKRRSTTGDKSPQDKAVDDHQYV